MTPERTADIKDAHRIKMAFKKERNATMTSDYPKPETRMRMVKVGGADVPQIYETGRTLGAGGYVINERIIAKTGAREIARYLRRPTA